MKKILFVAVIMLSGAMMYAQENGQKPVQSNRTLTHYQGRGNQSQDTVPVVRAMDRISSNAIVKLPNVVAIPAEAFRASNENGNNGYYKIRRDGLGTLAGTGETINNTLVAPLNLPDGAVIQKIYFNILSLVPHGYFPHFRLVQKGVLNTDRQKGAFSSNTPLNKYSMNSMGMNTASGLLDVKTLVADKLNYKINNKGFSYFFEVLANKSDRAPVDARDSNWPNDNYLFIWSVEVYYLLN
jgi:hypothetical protein